MLMSIAEKELGNNRTLVAPRVSFGEHIDEARLVEQVWKMMPLL